MRRVLVDDLSSGMVLARNIYSENGDVMLRRGVELTKSYIESLKRHGFAVVHICDGIADDIEPQEIVSEKVRAAARKHASDLFKLVRRTSTQITDGEYGPKPELFATVAPLVEQLSRNVESIVDEVLSAETLDGVLSLKSHDNYTFEHSVEVTVVGAILGKRLSLSLHELRQLALGGLLHDIGKLLVPSEIINKPKGLMPDEFALIQQHPQTGYEMVRKMLAEENLLARHVVWQHHERQDGRGYPRRLRGHNSVTYHLRHRFEMGTILLVAEIAAVADVYSALASDRPYRPAMEPEEIVAAMQQMAGGHLNREIVASFLSMLPIYPVGSEVVFASGELRGHRGVVIVVNREAIDRPRVRVIFDPNGQMITPFEIDTSKLETVRLAAPVKAVFGEMNARRGA